MQITPAVVLPEQVFNPLAVRPTAAVSLLRAVLVDGIQTYCFEILRKGTHSRDFRDAEWWLFAPDSQALTSFSNLCELFGLDARRLRAELLRFRNDPRLEVWELLLQAERYPEAETSRRPVGRGRIAKAS